MKYSVCMLTSLKEVAYNYIESFRIRPEKES